IGLYVVSTSEVPENFLGVDMYFAWTASSLQFLGIDNVGNIHLYYSGLPIPDSCHVNEANPPQDGTGYYSGFVGIADPPAVATAEGALMTTFLFRAVSETALADLHVLVRAPNCITTKVLDDEIPGYSILDPNTGYGQITVRTDCSDQPQACCIGG